MRDARPSDLKLTASAEWSTAGAMRVTWIVKLTNRTGIALRVVHPSSMYAWINLRRMGKGVDGWPRERGGFPAFWSWTLAPRATFSCSLPPEAVDPDALKTGRYDVVAYLNLSPTLLEAHRPLSIVRG